MTTTTQFQVGDTVLRYANHHDKTPATHKVVRVTKRTVVLDNDGGTFDTDGVEWGKGGKWFHAHIQKAD